MERLDLEAVMTYADQIRKEGEIKGKLNTLLGFLDVRPGPREKYEQLLRKASTLEELSKIESRLATELFQS
jgi:predicted component of type VI protein secretion system